MRKHQKRQRFIATFFLLIFFPTLVPTNLYATNNGPNYFEAASFEPVDATDMVNLATGDMSYVLPMLNVPSPEGGYPLSLSYHAGIAMEQEASWVGLGWALNPGAINRGVNGFPDDIISGKETNFIYDIGGEESNKSIGLSVRDNGITVGVGFYWGSNKSFGGSVSFGVGPALVDIGTGTEGTSMGFLAGYSNKSLNSTSTSFDTDIISRLEKNGQRGFFSSNKSFTKNDYDVSQSSKQYALVTPVFSLSYTSTKTKYRLFLDSDDFYRGLLYPFNEGPSVTTAVTNDVNKIPIYDQSTSNILNFYSKDKNYLLDNSLLPAVDNYSVNAQGLNGSITPAFTKEIQLRRNVRQSGIYIPNKYGDNVEFGGGPSVTDANINDGLFFEFKNTNASCLRIDRTNIVRDAIIENQYSSSAPSVAAYYGAKTLNSNIYNENVNPDNIPIKNNTRKRTGNYIETFTNQQILLNGNSFNFIEAKNINRSFHYTYLQESIGAYRITDIDGKTYHYSLPVINFETWTKNYGDKDDEDSNFALNRNETPYATDWLLTAITGSDYVDINNNHQVDNEDYGYWVEFDYGKWTDGYIWQTNTEEISSDEGLSPKRYNYFRGRKQIYYLDAVKTRTHTAYFVKGLREDAKGQSLSIWNEQAANESEFNQLINPKIFQGNNIQYDSNPVLNRDFYGIDCNPSFINGRKKNSIYADFPQHQSLKLEKIILVKNNTLLINKNAGNPLSIKKKAYLHENSSFTMTSHSTDGGLCDNITYYAYPYRFKNIDIHLSENVIDVNDVSGINVNQNAEKVINFGFDNSYPLLSKSKNSTALSKGKLTLKDIDFLGKNGQSYMPKYKFAYNLNPAYNESLDDNWGYYKDAPQAWSLNKITTPTGSEINISYQSDDYSKTIAKQSKIFNKGCSFLIKKDATTNYLTFEVNKNTHIDDNVIDDFSNNFSDYFSVGNFFDFDMFICRRSKYGGLIPTSRSAKLDLDGVKCQVTYVDNNTVKFKIQDSDSYWNFDDQDRGWILNRIFSLKSVKHESGANDVVIMRENGYRNCPAWRDSYDNDDVSFQYLLTSSKVPSIGRGGGIRVSEISVSDNQVVKNKTKFYYNLQGFNKNISDVNYKSSGEIPFVPSKSLSVLPFYSELPPPIVVYKNVSVENCNSDNQVISKTDYTFETYDGATEAGSIYNFGDKFNVKKLQSENLLINLYFSKYQIKDKLSKIGFLKSVKTYNSNNQLLSSTSNTPYTFNDTNGELGVKQESYLSKYVTRNDEGEYDKWFVNAITKIEYPTRLLNTETTSNGYSTKTSYDKFDFLTGQVTETTSILSDGKTFKTKTVPAYYKYPGTTTVPAMGSKIDNINNRNMLSQTAVEYSYLKDAAGNNRVTGVGITTWNNIWSYKDIAGNTTTPSTEKEKVWRKHKSYTWNGVVDSEGFFPTTYNSVTDDGFDWTGVGIMPSQWKQLSEVKLYNQYSMPLEMKDINNNLASTKMGDRDTKVMASGNAGYNEMYYSGGENIDIIDTTTWLEPEVKGVGITRDITKAHTGKYSIATTSISQFGVDMKVNQHRKGKYKLSVWVHKDNANKARFKTLSSATPLEFNGETVKAGDWVLKTHYFEVDSSYINPMVCSSDGTVVYFDDLMVRPVASSITGYVYNEFDELTYVISDSGLATKFEYDNAGRLIKTFAEIIDDPANAIIGGFKLKSTNKINYRTLN